MTPVTPIRIVVRVLLVVAVCAFARNVYSAEGDSEELGETLYVTHGCYTCHGYNGTGRRPLANATSGVIQNDSIFLAYLRARADIKPILPFQGMPHYAEAALPNDDALAILDYLRTLVDQAPEVKEAPALRAILESVPSDGGTGP